LSEEEFKFTPGRIVFWGIIAFISCVVIVMVKSMENPEEANQLGVLLGGVFFVAIIAVVIYAVLKTQQNTKEQLKILQNQKGQQTLAPESKGSQNSICPCCEKIVPTATMQQLKSNQLVCQQCYKTYCEQKLPQSEKT
jgi:hypothetical protein